MSLCADINLTKTVYSGPPYVTHNYFIDWLIIIISSNDLLYIS